MSKVRILHPPPIPLEEDATVIDNLLCNASEVQLRNVLAMVPISDAELVALFRKEVAMSAAESFDESHS